MYALQIYYLNDMNVYRRLCPQKILNLGIGGIVIRYLQTPCGGTSQPRSVQLAHRSLVRVCGVDSGAFLQGLVTADVSALRDSGALYSMILNAQGRVLYDIILYHHGDNDHLLECDSQAMSDVIKHLKRYTLRAKVEISSAESAYKLWAVFPGDASFKHSDLCFPDPRLNVFGTRVITDSTAANVSPTFNATVGSLDDYHDHRMRTGLAEGVEEVPVGGGFPLEYNLDLLNGVSFQKGCYVGQELTARTHHTGFVRKRVMPVQLSSSPGDIPAGFTVVNRQGKSLGKFICHRGILGLALLRVKESTEGEIFLKNGKESSEQLQLTPHRPSWWPSDLLM